MRILGSVLKSFYQDQCLAMSESIAFCALLALIPIGMVTVSIAGYFLGGSEHAFASIVGIASDILPVGRKEFLDNLQSILDKRSTLSIYGVFFLVLVSTLLMSSIERALGVIFKSQTRRNFFHSRLLGIALIFWITLLFSLPSMIRILETLLYDYGFVFPLSIIVTGKAYFFLVAFLAYVMTIVIVPNGKVYLRYAAFGGALFAAGIVEARMLFQWYISASMDRYNVIYGSLTAVVTMVLWIYYLAVLLLLSAEVVSVIQERMIFHRAGGFKAAK
jgi:membrane protein